MSDPEIFPGMTEQADSPLDFFSEMDASGIKGDEYTIKAVEESEPTVEPVDGEIPRERIELVGMTVTLEEVEDREQAALDTLRDAASETDKETYIPSLYLDTDGTRLLADNDSVGYELVKDGRRGFVVLPFTDVVERSL